MQEMLGGQGAVVLRLVQRLERGLQELDALALAAIDADADTVAHRGDAGGGDLPVVGEHRGLGRPAHLRARLELALQVVGVQLDQPRQQIVAIEIDALRSGAPGRQQLLNGAPIDHEAALDDRIRGHDPGIGDLKAAVHAAARRASMSISRSATASRTSGSWNTPRIAAPAALASQISSTTVARLSASSEAVGSSSSNSG